MKANNGSGDNELRDNWKTPQVIRVLLNQQYSFQVDCCADENNTLALEWYSQSHSFEEVKDTIHSMCWMNPPFSKAEIMFKQFFKIVKKGVAIYRCDNLETQIWQKHILPFADWIFIPSYRICYEGHDGKGARFPSALIGIGVPPPKLIKGTVLLIGLEKIR
jgi:hypothetical protein